MKRIHILRKQIVLIIVAVITALLLAPGMTVQAAVVQKTAVKTILATDAGIKLTWKKCPKSNGYLIYRSVNGGKYKKYKIISKNKTISFTDKKVRNGSQYQYRIKSYQNRTGKIKTSAFAASKKLRYLTKPSIIGKNQSGSGISISWKKNKYAKYYELKYSFNGTKKTLRTSKTTLSLSIPAVKKTTACTIYVRAARRDGSANSYSPWSKTTIQIRAPEKHIMPAGFDPDKIPDFNGEYVLTINGDEPFFTEEEKNYNVAKNGTFIRLSELDSLGRCGMAYACVGKETEPTEDRGDISSVYPSGWKQKKLSDGSYLYNRSHLLMFALTGLNADTRNLITGTRQFNADNAKGMYGWEITVKYAVDNYNAHVLYRVTPVFKDNELVARGVLMEAYCIEYPEECSYCRFIYNVQDHIKINYQTGESQEVTN